MAEERPLVCVVDDAQWLDAASALALVGAAVNAGHYAERNVLLEIYRAVRGLPAPAGPPRPLDLRRRSAIGAAGTPQHVGPNRGVDGDFADAASLIADAESVAAATGSRFPPFAALRLRALQGREAEASELIAAASELSAATGQAYAVTWAHWEAAVLYNGLARYEEASSAAQQATAKPIEPWVSVWALVELVEAAARGGDPDLAADAFKRLAEAPQPSGTDFALGVEARCRALVSRGETAERGYREAIDRLGRTRLRPELARAHLLYGEWLRREHRRVDAREQLRLAHAMLSDIGMEAFAERARRELLATGETARKRTVETLEELTPHEQQGARLAAGGQTNPEIAAQLFLSPRTVEWHLSKVFGKLGISSRKELRSALSEVGEVTAAA